VAEPVVLAMETAGSACSVAVGRGGVVLAAESRAMRHGHGEALFPMIERVMRESGLAPSQLDAVAAAIGPGGFTGIRVGLAAAQGIALAIRARLIGVSSFAAVAARLSGLPNTALDGGALVVALDSRRAELYVQIFALQPAAALAAPEALLADRLPGYVDGLLGGLVRDAPLLLAGDAAEAAAAALGGRAAVAIADNSAPGAEGVLAAALRQLNSAAPANAPVDAPVRPLYLRPPDVTLPKRRPLPAAAR
jgi:tRNA threonylcarbamoyladenosine biosynthesis protein TsaB